MRFPHDVPTLTDGEVTLRAHRPDDAPAVLEQCHDPLSRQWTTVPLEYTLADAEQFATTKVGGWWEDGSEWAFAVETTDGDVRRFAGTVSLRDRGEGRAEVAYGSHPWVRGRGVMERALRLLLTWGFEQRDLRMVVWWANRGNWASRRLAWRVGFRVEGEVRRWLPQRGDLLDGWVGTLLAGEPMEPRTPWLDAPRIVGKSVVLRRMGLQDVDRVVEACNDPETLRWLGKIPQPYGRAEAEAFIESREDDHAAGTCVTWAAADPETDQLVATLNIFEIRPGLDAEFGYWVHPDARGRGIATEAGRMVLRHAFIPVEDGGLGLSRVRGLAAEGNLASRRVLEKCGLTYQGRERRLLLVGGGRTADAAIYDVLKEEFRP